MKRRVVWTILLVALATPAVAQESGPPQGLQAEAKLSDRYWYVVKDMLKYCQPQKGFWIDVGAGKGQVTIPLIEQTGNPVIMLDPDAEAMLKGLSIARGKGLENRLSAVVGTAEDMPFPDHSVDFLISRATLIDSNFGDGAWQSALRTCYRVDNEGFVRC